MADTRYTPQGKKKKPKIVWQRFITFLLCVGMVIAFCTFGLKYMMTGRVVQAERRTDRRRTEADGFRHAAGNARACKRCDNFRHGDDRGDPGGHALCHGFDRGQRKRQVAL